MNLPKENFEAFKNNVRAEFVENMEFPIEDSSLIMKLEILENYAGTEYDDICISEVFFNDRFVAQRSGSHPPIERVYENNDQTALLLDDAEAEGKVVLRDSSRIVSLMQVSSDKQWGIITTMPLEIEGRAETLYHLIDLVNQEDVTVQIEKISGKSVSLGMVFEEGDYDQLYLDYYDGKIELKY